MQTPQLFSTVLQQDRLTAGRDEEIEKVKEELAKSKKCQSQSQCKLYIVESQTMQRLKKKKVSLVLFSKTEYLKTILKILKTVPLTKLQNHENQKTQSFIYCKVPSNLNCIIYVPKVVPNLK